MGPVVTPAPPQAAPTRLGRNVVAAAVGALLALALTLGVLWSVSGPAVIERVTINNPTPYPVEVLVAGAAGDAQLDLGPVSFRESHVRVGRRPRRPMGGARDERGQRRGRLRRAPIRSRPGPLGDHDPGRRRHQAG